MWGLKLNPLVLRTDVFLPRPPISTFYMYICTKMHSQKLCINHAPLVTAVVIYHLITYIFDSNYIKTILDQLVFIHSFSGKCHSLVQLTSASSFLVVSCRDLTVWFKAFCKSSFWFLYLVLISSKYLQTQNNLNCTMICKKNTDINHMYKQDGS